MKFTELASELEKIGYPVAYNHFREATEPPFVCYLVVNGDGLPADNYMVEEFLDVDIELYVKNKDLAAEQKIKDMLRENEVSWTYNEVYIREEEFYQCTFSVELENY